MRGALNLGKIAGIKLFIHWTFLLLIGWVVFIELNRGSSTKDILLTILLVLMVFVCVVLHELGHSLTARRYGIGTRQITLLPIGGVASLEKMPEEPKQELLVAVMGPVVNIGIALLLLPFLPKLGQYFDPENLEQLQEMTPATFVFRLWLINVLLVVFNAIPAFPMDGGRVLRALLSFRMDRVRATQIASSLGQFIAIGFFILGFFGNPFLILIGLFVFFGASGENRMVQQLTTLRGHRVEEAMMTNYTLLHPDNTVKEIGDALLAGTERNFVIEQDGQVVGILFHQDIIRAMNAGQRDARVGDIMQTEFRNIRPGEELTEVYRFVQGTPQSFFPVMENGKLQGTIDMENINEFMMIQAALDY